MGLGGRWQLAPLPHPEPLAFRTSRKQVWKSQKRTPVPLGSFSPQRRRGGGGAFPQSSLSPSYDSVLGLWMPFEKVGGSVGAWGATSLELLQREWGGKLRQ